MRRVLLGRQACVQKYTTESIVQNCTRFPVARMRITLLNLRCQQAGLVRRGFQRQPRRPGRTMRGCGPRCAISRSTGRRVRRLQYHGQAAHLVQAMVIEAVTGQDYRDVIRAAGDRAAWAGQRHLRRRADAAAEPLRRHLRAGTARQFPRVPCRGFAERRRLRDGARHGGVLPDAGRAAGGWAMCGCSRRG